MQLAHVLTVFAVPFHPPQDFASNYEIVLRWIHFLAAITWIGLLYFFNLVNIPFQKELDAATRAKINPLLLPKALWWFRWGSVVTVLAGLAFWMRVAASDARTSGYSPGALFGSFFLVWTVAFVIEMGALMGGVNKGAVFAIIVAVVTFAAAYIFLAWNSQVENNRVLSIGVGGGIGWFMMLNVWGIVWRAQKQAIAWWRDKGVEPMPEKLQKFSRISFLATRANALLSIPLLFFMGAASHYQLFGR
ncbi:MAG: urate hydroxylase PuuD [Acidobacteriaceae bacterium]|nr:urate hydroxylase PuuD [Acidobacteriaceae bacterium]